MLFSPIAGVVTFLWCLGFAIAMFARRTPEALCGWVIGGWLFMPQFTFDLPGLTLNKWTVIALAIGFASLVVKKENRTPSKFTLLDLPALLLPVSVFASSISNGVGPYDGFVTGLSYAIRYSIPWYCGKTVFSTEKDKTTIIRYLIAGGLIYVPFCLYEMKMAPVLHSMVYGYGPRGGENFSGSSVRFGLWRPTVFMIFGLQLSLFMGITSVMAAFAFKSRRVPAWLKVSYRPAALILFATTFLCVSTGAALLTVAGWIVIYISEFKAQRLVLLGLLAVPFVYPVYRMVSVGSFREVAVDSENEELARREASLNTRIKNEENFLRLWQERPLLGSTAWFYRDVGEGKDDLISDSQWIIILSKYGLMGWGCTTGMLLLPALKRLIRNRDKTVCFNADYALILGVFIYSADCLVNDMGSPIYLIMAGALAGSNVYGIISSACPEVYVGGSNMTSGIGSHRRPWPS